MLSAFNSRPDSFLSAGQNYPPVSVGELYSHAYQVPVEAVTETVVSHLDAHPEVPGVILTNCNKIHSVLPRGKMFERLGHRFGVELFIRKPVIELEENIETTLCMISSNTRIHVAAGIALGRKAGNIYDPLALKYDDGSFRMLDMHVLLMAQSLVAENMHNIVSNMNRIEHSIKADIPMDTSLEMIIDAIKRTTPHHHAAVLIKPSQLMKISSHHDLFYPLSETLSRHPLIKPICDVKTPVHVEDTRAASAWQGMDFAGKANVWLGLPIASGGNVDGVLSLSRSTNTPFSKSEIDMAKTFSEFLSVAINKTAAGHDERQFTEMIQRKFI